VKGAQTEKAVYPFRYFLLMETGMSKLKRIITQRKYFISLAIIVSLAAALVPVVPVYAAPSIELDPQSGPVGITVVVTGKLFDSYTGDNVRLFFDTLEMSGSPFSVPSGGTFTIKFTVPTGTAPGQHWVEVKSQTSSTLLARVSFTVDTPSLTINPAEGQVGTEVEIKGTGYHIDKAVNIYFVNPNSDKIGSQTASDIGEFSQKFVIPPGAAGNHKITASNAQGNSASINFKIIPHVTLNLTSAGPREPVKVSGTGFSRLSGVVIFFGTLTTITSYTDSLGSFETLFYVPDVKSISYNIITMDDKGLKDETTFTVTAGASLSTVYGSVGEKIMVRGTGFAAGTSVNISFDAQPITTLNTDNNGDFSTIITVPPGRGGDHLITIDDGTISKQLVFNVEKSSPPAPALIMPLNDSVTKAEAYFQWQTITDSSIPVTYNLQIASNQNFANIILQKTGLQSTEYTLNNEETLAADFKNAAYFWRVKAIDGAQNESEWSVPWVFYVSVPPAPALSQPGTESPVELPIRFSWQSVTSLSPPVSYNLEIASDLGFTSILLDNTDLKETDYLVTKEHKLKLKNNVIYYWRVKAVDNARNESDWSGTGSFLFSGPGFPVWAIYILIILAAAIAVLVAFRWGRKTAYH
jgi:hypothetical protein